MALHVFVDESRRGRQYLLAAVLLPSSRLGAARTLVRGLCLPGERRVHFQAENDSRRRKIAATLVAARFSARVYLGHGRANETRAACLRQLVTDIVKLEAQRLVLESRGHAGDRVDRAVIHQTLARIGRVFDRLSYEHLGPHEDPALGIPDAVAWCHGAGQDWRRRIAPIVEDVINVGEP